MPQTVTGPARKLLENERPSSLDGGVLFFTAAPAMVLERVDLFDVGLAGMRCEGAIRLGRWARRREQRRAPALARGARNAPGGSTPHSPFKIDSSASPMSSSRSVSRPQAFSAELVGHCSSSCRQRPRLCSTDALLLTTAHTPIDPAASLYRLMKGKGGGEIQAESEEDA